MTEVYNKMGGISVQFFSFEPDRSSFTYARAPNGRPMKPQSKWGPFYKDMKHDHVIVLTTFKSAPNGKSDSSYDIACIIGTLTTRKELAAINAFYWDRIEHRSDKTQATYEFMVELYEAFEAAGRGDELDITALEIIEAKLTKELQ